MNNREYLVKNLTRYQREAAQEPLVSGDSVTFFGAREVIDEVANVRKGNQIATVIFAVFLVVTVVIVGPDRFGPYPVALLVAVLLFLGADIFLRMRFVPPNPFLSLNTDVGPRNFVDFVRTSFFAPLSLRPGARLFESESYRDILRGRIMLTKDEISGFVRFPVRNILSVSRTENRITIEKSAVIRSVTIEFKNETEADLFISLLERYRS